MERNECQPLAISLEEFLYYHCIAFLRGNFTAVNQLSQKYPKWSALSASGSNLINGLWLEDSSE